MDEPHGAMVARQWLDDLVEATGTAASKLLPRLMELELLGCIEAPGGGRFVRPVR